MFQMTADDKERNTDSTEPSIRRLEEEEQNSKESWIFGALVDDQGGASRRDGGFHVR